MGGGGGLLGPVDIPAFLRADTIFGWNDCYFALHVEKQRHDNRFVTIEDESRPALFPFVVEWEPPLANVETFHSRYAIVGLSGTIF